jgi:hypothetical protein
VTSDAFRTILEKVMTPSAGTESKAR